ncbi:hypothetical protein SPAR169_1555 [Streptococcus pneumoniae GA62331]|nr:hypothetical protein SPAR169_1555 [Streptococcus pneumoniae GA62331]
MFTLYLLLWYNNIIEIIAETESVLAFLSHKFVDQVTDKELPVGFSKRQETIRSKISKPFIKEYL